MTELLFAVLIWKVIDYLRLLSDFKNQHSAIITQTTAFVGGIVAVILGAHAGATHDLTLGLDAPLRLLDWPSQVLVGLMAASLASAAVDLKQSIDGSDSAVKPPLVSPPAG